MSERYDPRKTTIKMTGEKYCDHYLDMLKKTYKAHQWLLKKIEDESKFPMEEAITYDCLIMEYEKYLDEL